MRSLVVIGAGWAGVSAAVEAADRGFSVTLIEERPYVGGRARSFTDKTTGEEIDNGQHLMMGCYHYALSVLKRLGTDKYLEKQDSLRVGFVERGGVLDELKSRWIPGSGGVALGILGLKRLAMASRVQILKLSLKIKFSPLKTEGITCKEFLQREGQSEEAISRFWEPIILATLNAPIQSASAHLLLAVMKIAFLGSSQDASLFIPRKGLSHFLSPIDDYLKKSGGSVLTSVAVESVRLSDGRVKELTLSSGATIEPDCVVFAGTQRALGRLLPELEAEIGQWNAQTSPIVSVYLWYSKSWMKAPFLAAIGTVIQWVFNRRVIHDSDEEILDQYPGHVSLTISAGSGLANSPIPEIIKQCDIELRLLFPEMKDVELIHGAVIKEKLATPLIQPGTIRPLSGALGDHANNLRIAGDWTETGLPATIEGAAQSGIHAVQELSAAKAVSRVR